VRNALPEVAHKLNSSLESVIRYAQLSLNRATDPEVKKELEKIIKEAQRACQIIRNHVSLIRKD